ncbi:MAG TPA: sensor domain-containing diguanylate cyclase [Gaiellaceae bacterium]
MTTAVIALAALAALLIVGWIATVGMRSRRASDERITHALGEVSARMDSLSSELADAITRAQEEGRRLRTIGALGAVADLDEVLARTVEAATTLAGVDAAIIRTHEPDGAPVVASLGLPAETAEHFVPSEAPDGARVRTLSLAYAYDADDEPAEALRAGVVVPLDGETERLGHLAVFSQTADWQADDRLVADLEEVAHQAGPAIENALRVRELSRAADTDPLTGLFNRRAFHETMEREVARAQRYDRRLALLLLDLDDFKDVNTRHGLLVGDAVLAEVAERLRDVARAADIVCRWGGDEFAVILPESSLTDAEGLFARIVATLQRRPPEQAEQLGLSAGIAELRPDDDAITFFERAEEALRRAKSEGKGRGSAA